MHVLGIHDGRDPCVALLRDGAVARIAFEADFADEPFEITGFTRKAVEQLLAVEKLSGESVDVIAYAGQHLPADRHQAASGLLDRLVRDFGYCGSCRGEMLAYFLRYRDQVRRP